MRDAHEHLTAADKSGGLRLAKPAQTPMLCYYAAMRILFVCTANKLRSPTAEDVFRDTPGIEAISAGTDSEAPRPLTKELVASADMIFAMETHHRERIRKKFKQRPPDNRIITLHIPDVYERGDPELVRLLTEKIEPRLTRLAGGA